MVEEVEVDEWGRCRKGGKFDCDMEGKRRRILEGGLWFVFS